MADRRETPPVFVVFAIVGGLLFILGGIVTAMSPNDRAVLIAAGTAFLVLGAYTVAIVVRHNRSIRTTDTLEDAVTDARREDRALRSRMAYSVRDPLALIVSMTDRLVEQDDLTADQRRAMLVEVRTNAREAEQVIADIAGDDAVIADQAVEGVVLLHEELRSVASATISDITFESELDTARAWGDAARVRQILRTVLNVARTSTCDTIALKTAKQGDRAVATISGRCQLLPADGIAAITGNAVFEDASRQGFIALSQAHALAVGMGGTIGYAQAMGVSHIVVDLPAAPDRIGLNVPQRPTRATISFVDEHPQQGFPPFPPAVELRPERPTASIRFS